jgi:Tfp pilus assembly pilus retraction ATPase PilT
MISLQGLLTATELQNVRDKTKLIFADSSLFKTAESVVVHEQNMLSDEQLLQACSDEYGVKLFTPRREYIPRAVLDKVKGMNVVPISYNAAACVMDVGIIPDLQPKARSAGTVNFKFVKVPIYYYVDMYTDYYGRPDFIMELPAKDYLDFIFSEAVSLKASDITIFNASGNRAEVIYNVRKRLVHSRRKLDGSLVKSLAHTLATSGSSEFDEASEDPRFFSIRVDMHNRGRVVVNKVYHGWCITIRVLPDDYLETSLEDLNIKPNACEFIRKYVLSEEKGLRLFIGETMSGKNTTILSALMELVALDKHKIVSVESPVEILVDGIIQINADTEDAFAKNADSLLRQNPDIVYFTEITEKTAYSILKQSNTSKAVFSSVHANSIADVISRLMDITGVDSDRVVQTLQSCVYQVLKRDDEHDRIYPENRCIHFDDELKSRLYGKPLYEKHAILKEVEDSWIS